MHLNFNPLKFLYRKVSSKKSPYFLAEKISKQKVSNRIEGGFVVPAGADTFSFVKIGNKKKPLYQQVITSFYDKEGNIIKRHIVDSDSLKIEKDYLTSDALNHTQQEINGFLKTKKIVTKTEAKNTKPTIKQDVFYIFKPFQKQKQVKLTRQTVKHTPYNVQGEGTRVNACITEYPMNYGKEPKNAKISVTAEMDMPDSYTGTDIQIRSISSTNNVTINKQDPFLAARFLLGEEKIKYLTKYFLKQKNLENMGIEVAIAPKQVPDGGLACFSIMDRTIFWKHVSKNKLVVDTAAHEAEHAYQHSLIGRYKKLLHMGGTAYEQDCAAILPKLTAQEKNKAKRYLIAAENYPSRTMADFYELYTNNLLEKEARKAGRKACKQYEKDRVSLFEQFRYVPNEGDIF